MDNKKLKALVRLLDDRNEFVFSVAHKELAAIGLSAIPVLESAWAESLDEILHERIENLIQHIQLENIVEEYTDWAKSDDQDLLYGAFLLAKFQYPELSYEDINQTIEKIIDDVRAEISDNLTRLEKVKVLNHIIFDINKFVHNTNFNAPQSAYMNLVFETRKGNSITLSIIYTVVAQRLNLPIYGVNLPRNYIIAYLDTHIENLRIGKKATKVIFYINPFNKGIALGRKEIDYFAKQHKLKPDNSFYFPCSNASTIQRLLSNLSLTYDKLGYPEKVDALRRISKIILKITGQSDTSQMTD